MICKMQLVNADLPLRQADAKQAENVKLKVSRQTSGLHLPHPHTYFCWVQREISVLKSQLKNHERAHAKQELLSQCWWRRLTAALLFAGWPGIQRGQGGP